MPWIKKKYKGDELEDFFEKLLGDIIAYVTDADIHGDDAWQLVRRQAWPYGTVLKIPNRLDGEYGYIALMSSKLRVGSSYWNWLKQPDILRKNFVLSKKGVGLPDGSNYTIDNGAITLLSKEGYEVPVEWYYYTDASGRKYRVDTSFSTNYRFRRTNGYRFSPQPEIFAKNADVLFFTMCKQYQEDFDWLELMGNERPTIKIKPVNYYVDNQRYPSFFDPPLYPGVGCPAIGYSPEFLTTQKNSYEQGGSPAIVYISKSRHCLNLVINFGERWDAASVGFFEAADTQAEYAFPAMTIGGTSGVLPMTQLVSYDGENPHVEHNFMLDYTESNWALSHGIAPFASTWWDGTAGYLDNYMYSPVQAMLPDGNWKSFANFGIRQESYYSQYWGKYFSAHKEPERIPLSKYFLTPNFTDISGTMSIYPEGSPLFTEDIAVKNRSVSYLEPLYFVQRTVDNIDQSILGRVPNVYWCSRPVTRYGEYEKDGKMYIIVPNAWENRKYHLKTYFSSLLGESQTKERQIAEMERLEKLSRCMNCAIELD